MRIFFYSLPSRKKRNLRGEDGMRKFPWWMIALILIEIGAAGTLGIGYQKANDAGVSGNVNIMTSQAIGVAAIEFQGWAHNDDQAVGAVAEDGLSYTIGMQLNNGDQYIDATQCIVITLQNYAKTSITVMLTSDYSITKPDQADTQSESIHIFYTEWTDPLSGQSDVMVGQLDPWHYLIEVPAATGNSPGKGKFTMAVDVGEMVPPGFYQFETFIEPTNWHLSDTANMELISV